VSPRPTGRTLQTLRWEQSGFEPLVPLLGGAAVKELFADYTAARQSEDLAAALKAGAALLWCAAEIPTASW
jgi:hypothetical protein